MVSGGQSTSVRNWRTMAVFLGPRHTTAEEREGSKKPSDIMCNEPIVTGKLGGWEAPLEEPALGAGGGAFDAPLL